LFGRFFGRHAGLTQVKVMAGYTPIFTPWDERPYEADVVRAAVDAIARNAAKLKAKHIRRVNGEVTHVKTSDIERVLSLRPNPWKSANDLLFKLVTPLMMDNNAWAYPVWEGGRLVAVYPVNGVSVELLEDGTGTPYVNFYSWRAELWCCPTVTLSTFAGTF